MVAVHFSYFISILNFLDNVETIAQSLEDDDGANVSCIYLLTQYIRICTL